MEKKEIEIDEDDFLRDYAFIEAETHNRLMIEWMEAEEEYEKGRLPAKIEVIIETKKQELIQSD